MASPSVSCTRFQELLHMLEAEHQRELALLRGGGEGQAPVYESGNEATTSVQGAKSGSSLENMDRPISPGNDAKADRRSDINAKLDFFGDAQLRKQRVSMIRYSTILPSFTLRSNNSVVEATIAQFSNMIQESLTHSRRSTMKLSSASLLAGFPMEDASVSCFVLDPSGPWRVCLDVLSMLMLLFDLMFTPYIIAWEVPISGNLEIIIWTTTILWTCDMLNNFRTGFYQDGKVEMRLAFIVRRYLKTFFAPDFIVVFCDWIGIVINSIVEASESSSADTVRLLRFAKAGRVLRIVGLVRIPRIADSLKRVADVMGVSSSMYNVVEVLKFLFIILWVNHVLSCCWYAIGNMSTEDGGRRWINSDETFADSTFWYQYSTAYHWSLAQMTPGSMEVYPRNTPERLFNILCLVLGMLFFGTLVSSLSSRFMHWRVLNQNHIMSVKKLRRFLLQCEVPSNLRLRIEQMASLQLQQRERRPLVFDDVEMLKLLPLSLSIELKSEICGGYLSSLPLFRLWMGMDVLSWQHFLNDHCEMLVLLEGSNLFVAGSQATNAYYVIRGDLTYLSHACGPDKRHSQVLKEPVPPQTMLCEASMWCQLLHAGTIEASKQSELITLSSQGFSACMSEHQVLKHFAAEYCQAVHARLESGACPLSQAHDLPSLLTNFELTLLSLPGEYRTLASLVAFSEHVREVKVRKRPPLVALFNDVLEGQCTLSVRNRHDLYKISCQVTLKVVRHDSECALLQLGRWTQEGFTPCKQLPGASVRDGEWPEEAAHRLANTEWRGISSILQFQNADSIFENLDPSVSGGIAGTTRICVTYTASTPSDKLEALRFFNAGTLNYPGLSFLEEEDFEQSATVFATSSGDGLICFFMWLPCSELDHVLHGSDTWVTSFFEGLRLDAELWDQISRTENLSLI